MPNQSTSTNIRVGLVRTGKTQGDIAAALGISQVSVSARMQGQIDWRISELRTVAELLNVPVAQLIEEPAPADQVASRSWNADDRTCQRCSGGRTFVSADQLAEHVGKAHESESAASA